MSKRALAQDKGLKILADQKLDVFFDLLTKFHELDSFLF